MRNGFLPDGIMQMADYRRDVIWKRIAYQQVMWLFSLLEVNSCGERLCCYTLPRSSYLSPWGSPLNARLYFEQTGLHAQSLYLLEEKTAQIIPS